MRLTVFNCLKIILLIWLASAGGINAQANEMSTVITLPSNSNSLEISDKFAIAEDASGLQSLVEIQNKPFVQTNAKLLKGYSTNAQTTYWLRFTIVSANETPQEWWLDVEPPFLDSVELFKPDGKGGFQSTRTGDKERFSSREIVHGSFAFKLNPISKASQTYYLRIRGEGSVWVRAVMWRPAAFAENAAQLAHGQGMTFGALLLLILLIMLQGASFKDKLYFIFAAYVATTVLFLGAGMGIFARYLPDSWSYVAELIGPISVCLNVTTYAVFCRYFLYERQQDKLFRSLFLMIAGLGLLAATVVAFTNMRWLMPAVLGLKVIGTFVPAFSAGSRLIRGHLNDRLVWLGILSNIPVQIVLMLRLAGEGEKNAQWLSLHWFTAALLIHFILLSFALVERARRLSAEKRSLQEQIGLELQLKKAAEKTANEQRSFLGMVAHELRGPLSIASTANYNLKQILASHSIENTGPRLDRIENSIAQMSSLIDVCLVHEQKGKNQPLSMQQSVKIVDLIELTKSLLSEAISQRIRWPSIDSQLPKHYELIGSSNLIAIALRNLIENACRYDTSLAEVEVALDFDATQNIRFSVLDQGPGIPAELGNKLFEQFSRGTQVQSDGLGVGLGLYIVQRIASMHEGAVSCKPREQTGSVFTLTLPLVKM
jgi:two-component system, sensor histidine kinase LadS